MISRSIQFKLLTGTCILVCWLAAALARVVGWLMAAAGVAIEA